MGTEFSIRKAVPEDEAVIRALFLEMLKTIHHTDAVDGYEDGYLDRYWSGGEDRIFVAETDAVIAFLSAEIHRDLKPYIYLDDFSVTEAYRNKGIGTALIRAAESYCN